MVLDCGLLDPEAKGLVAASSSELALKTKHSTLLQRYVSCSTLTNIPKVIKALGRDACFDIRPTTEATMVLFDASQSMSLVWAEGLLLFCFPCVYGHSCNLLCRCRGPAH